MGKESNEHDQDVDLKINDSENDRLNISRVPIILWIILIYFDGIVFQNVSKTLPLQTILFSLVMMLHVLLYWHVRKILQYGSWTYFIIQAGIIFSSALLLPDSFPIVLVGLIPILIGQSIGIYYQIKKVVMIFFGFYLIFCLALVWRHDAENSVLFIALLILIVIVVAAYSVLFYRQVNARIRTQNFLNELELAHQKVEELTLANERQRMARDLHDTLAQGLAGLIMQMEAVDAHLTKGSSQRAHEIVQQSMSQARKALADSRRAIDNLRSKSASEVDFADAVREEAQRFTMATGIRTAVDIKIKSSVSRLLIEHGLHIISECLTNVAKHSHAKNVWINILDNQGMISMGVRDDGKGFNPDNIAKQAGHYGLIGIHERTRLLGGTIHINSTVQEGTSIKVEAPLLKET
ncbi:membrane associated, signal transduction histidine kinase-like ATPase [Paenibacillus terrae HPL-003]|uniref:histidine kinase n=1 Tax=Paenibacillus terrae (strain HPL-003) TaxID=985665 RepID=G7VP60_PAETH|nr:sensor histidine kinase [Paenibacillus terrae]AET60937.1 membrane associated, signal transduction histidine kinase-like ATPase [Paenibacillus terrae HPL-003]